MCAKIILKVLFCSLAFSSLAFAILGGRMVRERDPNGPSRSVVLVELKNDQKLLSFCTGTLIATNAVLTAAHCFDPYLIPERNRFEISFDVIENGFSYRKTIPGTFFKIHPKYSFAGPQPKILENDIAVAFFNEELPMGFAPVPIDTNFRTQYNNRNLHVFGYGRSIDYRHNDDRDPQFSSGILREAILKVSSDYYAQHPLYYMNESNPRTSAHLCQGDSGGPQFLVTKSEFKIVGVNSGGGIARKDGKGMLTCVAPGSVAKVAPAAKWIQEQIKRY